MEAKMPDASHLLDLFQEWTPDASESVWKKRQRAGTLALRDCNLSLGRK
jgi:hypothetical protein